MAEPVSAGSMPISAFIADTIVSVAADSTLLEVADVLADGDVGALVIGEVASPAGVVSERDLIGALSRRLPADTTRASDVASTELVWCDITATVAEVAGTMCERYLRHVLVEEDGRLVGIVSARDLLGAYASGDMELEP